MFVRVEMMKKILMEVFVKEMEFKNITNKTCNSNSKNNTLMDVLYREMKCVKTSMYRVRKTRRKRIWDLRGNFILFIYYM